MRALHHHHLGAGHGAERPGVVVGDVHLAGGDAGKELRGGIEGRLVVSGHARAHRQLKRSRVDGRHEDVARQHIGRRHHSVGTLTHKSKQTAFGQQCRGLLRSVACGVKLSAGIACGLDFNAQKLASLAALHGLDGARYGGHQLQPGVSLVVHERRTGLHDIAHSHIDLGREARIVVGHYGHAGSGDGAGSELLHASGYRQVKALGKLYFHCIDNSSRFYCANLPTFPYTYLYKLIKFRQAPQKNAGRPPGASNTACDEIVAALAKKLSYHIKIS